MSRFLSTAQQQVSKVSASVTVTMVNIWDSEHALEHVHPLYFRALQNVKIKINNCLSRAYAIADKDDTTNHKDVLLHQLHGTFSTMNMDVEIYGRTTEAGIFINETLAQASTAYIQGNQQSELETASYLALLEETIEHELAHLKYHQERVDDPQIVSNTPPDPPYNGECGFAVCLKIRERSATQDLKTLEVSEACLERNYAPPLELSLFSLAETLDVDLDIGDEDDEDDDGESSLTLDEIRAHMEYPTDCKSKRPHPPSQGPVDQKRPKSGDNSDGNRDDSDTKQAHNDDNRHDDAKQQSHDAKHAKHRQTCTDSQGNDRTDSRKKFNNKSHRNCIVTNVVFCNENRQIMSSFSPNATVYTLVSLQNQSEDESAFLHCGNKEFSRIGLFLQIQGIPLRGTPCCYGSSSRPFVELKPGETYTFFRVMMKPVSWKKPGFLATPEQPGKYVVTAKYSGNPKYQFDGVVGSFDIVADTSN